MTKLISLFLLIVSQFAFAASCETKRDIFIENDLTKVWKTTICPQEKLPFHSHQYARVVIPEENGSLKVIYQSGKETIIKFEKKTPIFLSEAEGLEMHQDVNTGEEALHVTVIELKKAKA